MLLYWNSVMGQHLTGRHPESSARLESLGAALEESGWMKKCTRPNWIPATLAQLSPVHDAAYLEQLPKWCASNAGRIEADTVVSPKSFLAATIAAGAACDAVEQVLGGKDPQAFCAIRPPGHHAVRSGAMGFCLLNNVAIAAHHALSKGLERVLIVDWDVHHGNGTQDAFYRDSRVAFFSSHRFPFYPGSGKADETGEGDGLGWTVNYPIAYGTDSRTVVQGIKNRVEKLADRLKPQLILLSAGFDAHPADPVGGLSLNEEEFEDLGEWIARLAKQHCQGRIVSLLEGGYHLDHMPSSVIAHLEGMAHAS